MNQPSSYPISQGHGEARAVFAAPAPGMEGEEGSVPVKEASGFHLQGLSLRSGERFLLGEVKSLVRPAEVARLDLADGPRPNEPPRLLTVVNDLLFLRRAMSSPILERARWW